MIETQFTNRRDQVSKDVVSKLKAAGALVEDPRRRRPYYFDGRFLTARDLVRDQQYFLTRQQDVGRAIGWGIVEGLRVEPVADEATVLQIHPGLGISRQGETVVLETTWRVNTVDVAQVQRLDTAFGLNRRPNVTLSNPTGLFIVAIRPVEYTANPIASYPTEVGGERTVEDGDIIDALAVALIPCAGADDGTDADRQRSWLARKIFLEDAAPDVPPGALPLAVVQLDRGFVRWVDNDLVRRELVGVSGDVLEFYSAPRTQREAYLSQYDNHLSDVMQRFPGRRFAATDLFDALPPVGRMPAAAIEPADFTQFYLPAEVDVDLSLIANDELPALIETAGMLPAIDLRLRPEELESTAVRMFIPLPRAQLRKVQLSLTGAIRTLRPAAGNLVSRRRPRERLLRLRGDTDVVQPAEGENSADAAWQKLLSAADTLWFARRHNVGQAITRSGNAPGEEPS